MTKVREIAPGERVRFLDGETQTTGTVNGAPFLTMSNEGNGERHAYVPVYVIDGDRCLIVDFENITAVGVDARPTEKL